MRIVVLICVTACGRLGFDDASPRDAAPDGTIDWTLWSTPMQIATAATDQFDWEPAIDPDNKVLVFTRADATLSTSDLFVTTRSTAGGDFGTATKLALSQGGDFGPAWTPDGKQLYFTSSRSGSSRLYIADFDGTVFGPPVMIPEFANEDGVSPTISSDGLEMFYSDGDILDNKIRRAHRTSTTTPWLLDGIVSELDSPSTDGWPTLSPDGLAMLFESGRDSDGGFIYEATRPAIGAPFGDIHEVVDLDDGSASGDPEITADGQGIFFAAERLGGDGGQDIYFAARR